MNIVKLLVDTPETRAQAAQPSETHLEPLQAAFPEITVTGLIHYSPVMPTRISSLGDAWVEALPSGTVTHIFDGDQWISSAE